MARLSGWGGGTSHPHSQQAHAEEKVEAAQELLGGKAVPCLRPHTDTTHTRPDPCHHKPKDP